MKTIILFLLLSVNAHAIGNSSLGFSFNPQQKSARNYVKNPNAERTASRYVTYTNTSGTRNTTNPILGLADFQATIDSATDTIDFDLFSFDQKLKNNNCIVQLDYKSASASIDLQVRRSATTIASTTLTATTDPKSVMIPFECGDLSAATSIRITGTSATSTVVNLGNLFVGAASASSAVINTGGEWVGSVLYPATTNCVWSVSATSTFQSFPADTDCATATVSGVVQAPGTKIPAVVIPNADPRYIYRFIASGMMGTATANAYLSFRFSDGTVSSRPNNPATVSVSGDIYTGLVSGEIEFTSAGSKTVNLQAATTSGSFTINNRATATNEDFLISVYRFPKTSSSTGSIFEAGDYGWTSCTMNVGATTTAPTKGTVVIDECKQRRVGDTMFLRWNYQQSGGGSAGSGTYLFPIPGGLQADTTKITPTNTTEGAVLGSAGIYNNAMAHVKLWDANNLVIVTNAPGLTAATFISDSVAPLTSTAKYSFEAAIPISGWSTFPFGIFSGPGLPVSARVSGNPGATSTGASPNYPTEDYDPKNMYSAGLFTFPEGKTHCQVRYYWTGDANNLRAHCYKNGVDQNRASDNDTNGPGWQGGVCFFDGVAGDTFNVRPTNTAMTGNASNNAHATCW